ncbi:MAG TPA: hypothetical protein PKH77_15410 [Anaerolineae bacterium]|nr:hypothetical protein [Anaerolineae bacterium]
MRVSPPPAGGEAASPAISPPAQTQASHRMKQVAADGVYNSSSQLRKPYICIGGRVPRPAIWFPVTLVSTLVALLATPISNLCPVVTGRLMPIAYLSGGLL